MAERARTETNTELSNEEMNWMKASKLIHNAFTEGLRIIFRREFERQVGIAWQDTPDVRRFVVVGGEPLGTFTDDIVPCGGATARKPGERNDVVLVDLDLTGRLKKDDLICVWDAVGNNQFLRLSKKPTAPVVAGGVTRCRGKLQLNMSDGDVLLPTVPRDVNANGILCGIRISTASGPGVSKIACGNGSPAKLATASCCEWDATALRLVLVGSTFAGRDAELLPMWMGSKSLPETNPAVIKAGWGKTHGPGDVVAHIMQAYRNDMVAHPPAGCAVPDEANGRFPNGFNDLVEMMNFFAEHVVQEDSFRGLIDVALAETPEGGWTPNGLQQIQAEEIERSLAQSSDEVVVKVQSNGTQVKVQSNGTQMSMMVTVSQRHSEASAIVPKKKRKGTNSIVARTRLKIPDRRKLGHPLSLEPPRCSSLRPLTWADETKPPAMIRLMDLRWSVGKSLQGQEPQQVRKTKSMG
jgi:hypothetical protein